MTMADNARPCMVAGRRGIFHRWTDSARPVKPRGMEDNEDAPRFQVWNVHGIVEFEDGQVARIWPSEIQFVDGGAFESFNWPESTLPWTIEETDRKKPVMEMDAGVGYLIRRYNCPTCGKRVASYTYGKPWTENGLSELERIDCPHCAQPIDWTDVPTPGQDNGGANG